MCAIGPHGVLWRWSASVLARAALTAGCFYHLLVCAPCSCILLTGALPRHWHILSMSRIRAQELRAWRKGNWEEQNLFMTTWRWQESHFLETCWRMNYLFLEKYVSICKCMQILDPRSYFLHLDVAPCGEARSKWALNDKFCPVFPWGRGKSFVFLSIFNSQPGSSGT